MPESQNLERAKLIEVTLADADREAEKASPPKEMEVQFNPETLSVTYANQVGKTNATGSSAMQFLASSTSTLSVDLWFDATVHEDFDDVRKLTADVHYFVLPSRDTSKGEAKFIIPAVRFSWGSFAFEGVVTGLTETIDFFSADGRPLRSKMGLTLASQDIQFKIEELKNANSARGGSIGQAPQPPVADGQSVQDVAAASGSPAGWKVLAELNDIENPRAPGVGRLLTGSGISATVSVGGVGSASIGLGG